MPVLLKKPKALIARYYHLAAQSLPATWTFT